MPGGARATFRNRRLSRHTCVNKSMEIGEAALVALVCALCAEMRVAGATAEETFSGWNVDVPLKCTCYG